jgi:hypothetical protein
MTTAEDKIADVRRDLTEKLEELQRRGTRARAALSPSTYLRNPWLRIGLGFVVGYAIGHRTSSEGAGSEHATRLAGSSLVRGVVRASLLAAFEALLREAVTAAPRPLATSARPIP